MGGGLLSKLYGILIIFAFCFYYYPLLCFVANVSIVQGSYPPRGPVAHPASQRSNANSMYHGGEVLPDRVEDVVDSPAGGNDNEETEVSDKEGIQLEECPRCLRRFDGEDSDAILKHIERCIS